MSNMTMDEKMRAVRGATPTPPAPFVPAPQVDMAARTPATSETIFPETSGTKLNLYDPKVVMGADDPVAIQDEAPCPFGKIITIPNSNPVKRAINGGVIHCGDKTFSIDHWEINLGSTADVLVWFALKCTVNTDDDGELLLSGVKTGSKPTWSHGAFSSGYPNSIAPSVKNPQATRILPVGRLTVAGGSPTFEPLDCGNFVITHCAGDVLYYRFGYES
jgi:hypothetical protein